MRHSVEVTADTLYEAAATALSIFKQSEWADVIGPNTELHVAAKYVEKTFTLFETKTGVKVDVPSAFDSLVASFDAVASAEASTDAGDKL